MNFLLDLHANCDDDTLSSLHRQLSLQRRNVLDRAAQQWQAAVTTAGDEVQTALSVIALQSFGHGSTKQKPYDADGMRTMKSNASGGSCTGTVTVDMLYSRNIAGNTIAETDGSGSTSNSSYHEYVFFAGGAWRGPMCPRGAYTIISWTTWVARER